MTEDLITSSHIPDDHPNIPKEKVGVLLLNLGTPDSTDFWSIRRYLKEFLSDNRVIEVNPIIWQIILNLFILTFRPSKTAKAYKEIWMKDKNMSPLRYYTMMQTQKLSKKFNMENLIIDFAMRYGSPSINGKIKDLKEKGCQDIIILPLYPQYAAATTATVCDEVYRSLMGMRWQPSLQIIPHYESHPLYIDALVNSLNNSTNITVKCNEVNNKIYFGHNQPFNIEFNSLDLVYNNCNNSNYNNIYRQHSKWGLGAILGSKEVVVSRRKNLCAMMADKIRIYV